MGLYQVILLLFDSLNFKASKKISRNQMDVGMSSIQAYKAYKQEGTLVSKVHKQGALGTSSQASLHQWLHYIAACINQTVFFNFCNLDSISYKCFGNLDSISYNYHAATDVGMLGKMCRVPLVCVPCLPVFLLVCMLCRPVCWTSLHPFDFI